MELKVDGRKVHAATGGRAFDAAKPVVVFLHGAGCDHTVWQLPARWFAWHGYSVLAVDLPGHGRSEGPPLASVADMASWVGALLDAAGVRAGGARRPLHGRGDRARGCRGDARARDARRPAGHGGRHPGASRSARRGAGGARARLPDDDGVGARRACQDRRQSGAGPVDDRRHAGAVRAQPAGRAAHRSRGLRRVEVGPGRRAQGALPGPRASSPPTTS